MKYAERLAQIAFFGLLIIAAGLTYAIVQYHTVSFWAGALAAYSHAMIVALLWWGLRLARQQQELAEAGGPAAISIAPESGMGGLSAGDDNPAFANNPTGTNDVRTLETGFQRVVVGLTSFGLWNIVGIIIWLVVLRLSAAAMKPGEPIPISPFELDNGALVAAFGALAGYVTLFYITRVGRQTQGYGEALHGILTMGMAGSVAITVAVFLGYFKVGYAGEIGSLAVAFLLWIQALELLFNAFRRYVGVEEFDEVPVDLQALPLVPMISSQWILGLRILLGQSFGLGKTGDGETGVFARIMPRVIIAVLVVLVGTSMVRSVPTGTVAIRERLGYAGDTDINNPLQPGLHILAPWPIDKLVVIPTAQLQEITVGAEEMAPPVNGKVMEFSLWTTQHTAGGQELEYITGDKLLLGGYVGVWWRVRNPSDFYRHVSHSDFYGGEREAQENQGRPIYESLVQDNATYAVIHAFGANGLEDIMAMKRSEVQKRCQEFLQDRLDHLGVDAKGNQVGSGIEIVDLSIKDVHPPQGDNEIRTPTGMVYGPARSYEEVEIARENKEAMIDDGTASRIGSVNQANGISKQSINRATGDAVANVNQATGDTAYVSTVAQNLNGHEDIAEERLKYGILEQLYPKINKILIGEGVKRPQVIQAGSAGTAGTIIPVGPPQ